MASVFQGLMGDFGIAAKASQAYQQEELQTEQARLQNLMVKQKMQQDQDTAASVRAAQASDMMTQGGYKSRIKVWQDLHNKFMASGNLSGAETADKEMKRLQEAAGDEQKQSLKEKTDQQEDAAHSARVYKSLKSSLAKGATIDPSYRQEVIDKVEKFDPETANKMRSASPSQFDSILDVIEKGSATSNQINSEGDKTRQFEERERRMEQQYKETLKMQYARIQELEKVRQGKEVASSERGSGLVGSIKSGDKVSLKDKGSAIKATAQETGFSETEVGEKYSRAEQLRAEIEAQEKKNRPLESFHGTVVDNLKLFKQAISKLKGGSNDPSDFKAFNSAYYALKNATGQATTQYADVMGKEVAGELTKLMTTANATGSGGTLTDRESWENLFRVTQSGEQLNAVINAVENSLENRMKNVRGTVESMEKERDNLWKKPGEKDAQKSEGSFSRGGKTIKFKRID